MNLKEVKESDHSWWLRYLEENTHFDCKRIKEQLDWLIEQAELLDKIANRWVKIETNGTSEEADNFYTFVQDTLTPKRD